MEFKRYVPKAHSLHCVLIGKQGAGKSSILGSLARAPMLLIYNAAGEAHSPDWAAKAANEIYPDATSDNIFPVRIDVCEEMDTQVFQSVYGDKLKMQFKPGDTYSSDFSWFKVKAYLEVAKSGFFKAVCVDSLNAMAPVIRGTTQWTNFCKNSKGNHDNFKESDAFVDQYREIVTAFTTLKALSIHCVATCLAKPQYDQTGPGGADSAIIPVLPAFGVVEQIIPFFMDICVVNTFEGRPALDFGVKAYKASKDQNGKIKKYINIEPRLNCAPTGLHLEALYPDLWHIQDIVKAVEQQAKSEE